MIKVQAAGRPPIQDAGGAAVADLDEPRLLETVDRLAHSVPVDSEPLAQLALGRNRIAWGQVVGEDRVTQVGMDGV